MCIYAHAELQKFTASRMQLDTQVNENKTVKEVALSSEEKNCVYPTHTFTSLQELDRLEEGAVLYKLVGPVLVKQELSEAKLTVEKRLKYITKES